MPRVPTSSRFGFVYVVFVVWFFFSSPAYLVLVVVPTLLRCPLAFLCHSHSYMSRSGSFHLDLKFLHVFYCEYKLVCTTFLFLHMAYAATLLFFLDVFRRTLLPVVVYTFFLFRFSLLLQLVKTRNSL